MPVGTGDHPVDETIGDAALCGSSSPPCAGRHRFAVEVGLPAAGARPQDDAFAFLSHDDLQAKSMLRH
jgi:hypothetical protein